MSNAPTEFIELRKQRDFSAVISTGFQFIRVNWKTLYRPLVFIALPVYIVASLLFGSFFRTAFTHQAGGVPSLGMMVPLLLGYALLIVSLLLMYTMVFEYMRFYMLNKGLPPTTGQLLREVRKELLAYFANALLAGLIAMAGMLLCILPGIWLGIVFVVVLPLRAFERADVGDCISRSFVLVKGHWWMTFGLVTVLSVLISLISYIVYLPFMLIAGFGTLSGLQGMHAATEIGSRMAWLMTLFMVLAGVVSVILQPFLQVSIGLHALSLIEEKEGRGLMQRVDDISFDPKA